MRLDDLQRCIDKQNANNSQAREMIFRVLLDTDECLDVAQILDAAQEIYPKKISLNTVYRHLNFFVDCGLAIALQNDSKKAYYCLVDQKNKVFSMCPKCGLIQKIHDERFIKIMEDYDNSDYITIHKKCHMCL